MNQSHVDYALVPTIANVYHHRNQQVMTSGISSSVLRQTVSTTITIQIVTNIHMQQPNQSCGLPEWAPSNICLT